MQMYASVVCSASATKLPQKLETIVTSFQAVPDPMQVRTYVSHIVIHSVKVVILITEPMLLSSN